MWWERKRGWIGGRIAARLKGARNDGVLAGVCFLTMYVRIGGSCLLLFLFSNAASVRIKAQGNTGRFLQNTTYGVGYNLPCGGLRGYDGLR